GGTGTVNQLRLSYNALNPRFGPKDEQRGGDSDNALLASRSTDGGLHWSDPAVVIRDLDANVINDKQTMTADPNLATNVYAVWDRLVIPARERASVMAGGPADTPPRAGWCHPRTEGGSAPAPPRQAIEP